MDDLETKFLAPFPWVMVGSEMADTGRVARSVGTVDIVIIYS